MNTRSPLAPRTPTRVLSVAFNSDSTMFIAGFEDGFRVYESEGLHLRTKRIFGKGVAIAELRGRSNFTMLVGGGKTPIAAPNRAHLWDEYDGKRETEIKTSTNIKAIRVTSKHIVVVLQNSVSAYLWEVPPKHVATWQTSDNLLGLCCASEKYLACPGQTSGHVQVVEIASGAVSIIPAHTTPLRAIAFSPDGELLATASDQGTLIRVYATHNTAKITELRRGLDPAIIYSLAFSPSGASLACTSDKLTLHVFDIPNRTAVYEYAAQSSAYAKSVTGASTSSTPKSPEDNSHGKWGVLGKVPFMPKVFSDIYSFASADIDIGDESLAADGFSRSSAPSGPKPAKGLVAWLNDETIIVLSAGLDARWEKYGILVADDGKRVCRRLAWKRFARET